MSYKFSEPHPYVDLSKRKPYTCGVCLRDITHPLHQSSLPGTQATIPQRHVEPEYDAPPRIDNRQPSLFEANL